ncbi:MAG TPA: hypothetical protein VGR78_04560 [Verrucomicrobiae bacterium]|jgi:hypothetical protein|nr:hypothetical protein [Verrucomicrobiae bacterium]
MKSALQLVCVGFLLGFANSAVASHREHSSPPVSFGVAPVFPLVQTTNEQRQYVAARPILIAPDQVTNLIVQFKTAYTKMGNPRIVFSVNLDDPASPGATNIVATGQAQQGLRDLERLFGRPLRMAGADLVDQPVNMPSATNQPANDAKSDQARKNHEALAKIADLEIEIIASTRPVAAAGLSGDITYWLPEIHATAIRLSNGRIVGQATAADIVNESNATTLLRYFDSREIAEATALALMQDMLLNVPQ